MKARRTLPHGQKGKKKFLGRYGKQSVCIRFRYDEQRRKHGGAIEIIVLQS